MDSFVFFPFFFQALHLREEEAGPLVLEREDWVKRERFYPYVLCLKIPVFKIALSSLPCARNTNST